MIDQLIIGDKSSYDDYGASMSGRKISPPKKKSIKETVPFSNVTYDFTKINGEIYWEDRNLEYTFEMIADTPEKLEEMRAAFEDWVLNIIQEELHDPFIPDYHFIATYNDLRYSDDEGLDKTTATVKFTAYPYKVANHPVEFKLIAEPLGHSPAINSVWVLNSSSHRITPTIISDGTAIIDCDSAYNEVTSGESKATFELETGHNLIRAYATGNSKVNITIRFNEEVF